MVDVNKNGLLFGIVLISVLKWVDEVVYLNWKFVVEGIWIFGVVILGVCDNGVDWVIDDYNRVLVFDIVENVEVLKIDFVVGKVVIKLVDDMVGCVDVL